MPTSNKCWHALFTKNNLHFFPVIFKKTDGIIIVTLAKGLILKLNLYFRKKRLRSFCERCLRYISTSDNSEVQNYRTILVTGKLRFEGWFREARREYLLTLRSLIKLILNAQKLSLLTVLRRDLCCLLLFKLIFVFYAFRLHGESCY